MRHKKASLLTGAMVAVALLGLAACGDDDSDNAGASTTSAAASASGQSTEASKPAVEHKVLLMLQPGIPPNVPVQVGIDQGFFKKHGVVLEQVQQPSGATPQQLLLGGAANFTALSPAGMAQGFQQDQHFAYACGVQLFNPNALIAPKGSDLPRMSAGASSDDILKALKGKTVGTPLPPGSGSTALFQAALQQAGVDPSSVTIVVTGSGPTLLGALSGKQVDAAISLSPQTEQLTTGDAAVAEELMYLPDGPEGYRDYGTGFAGSREWLEKNPEAAAAFCAAINDVAGFIADEANAEQVGKAVTTVAGADLTPDVLNGLVKRFREVFVTEIPEKNLMDAVNRAVKFEIIPATPLPTYADMVIG